MHFMHQFFNGSNTILIALVIFLYNNNPRISELDQIICDCLCNLVAPCAHQNEDITKI